MNCAHKALLVVGVVTTLGLWGCTQNHAGNSSTAARIRDLEARNAKLEEDYKAAAAESTDLRKKLADSEDETAHLTQKANQLQVVLRERDRLRQQVASTQKERNHLQARLQEFSRDLQALVGRVDAAASGSPPPAAATSTTAIPESGGSY
jgi:chromosome segregation ATPase